MVPSSDRGCGNTFADMVCCLSKGFATQHCHNLLLEQQNIREACKVHNTTGSKCRSRATMQGVAVAT
jgi:hypothetical protein